MSRIALVSPFTLPVLSGNSLTAERLRKGLLKRGHEVRLYNASEGSPEEAVRFEPDLLHSFNAERPRAWMAGFLRRLPRPWVVTLTGTDYNAWYGREAPPPHLRESLEKAGAIVTFHEEARQVVSETFPHLRPRLELIPQGVSVREGRVDRPALRERFGLDPDRVVFLMVAGLRSVKNIPCGLRAITRIEVAFPEAVLLLAGPVMEQAEADRIREMGRGLRCFRYLGELPPESVRDLMACSDIFLNTSYHEGMPGAVLEAMAEGLPVLASDAAGNRALVREGESGFFFPVDDEETLAERALNLAADPALRRRMGAAGRRIITKEHPLDDEIARYERVYARLMERKT
jgi:glycosyltransferase involved in cell wall biosynthesis